MLLSCGGGGMRGKITTTFLELLEKDLDKPLNELFDGYAGTSTGSLICAGLASNLSAKEINNVFYSKEKMEKIFSRTWWSYLFKRKYQTKEIYNTIESLEIKKKLFVVTYNYTQRKPRIFTDNFHNALKASIAAPTYFPPHKIDDCYYIDGTMCCNNPNTIIFNMLSKEYEKLSEELCDWEMDDDKNKLKEIIEFQKLKNGKILFVGTGYKKCSIDVKNIENWGIYDWYKHDLLDILLNGDEELNRMECESDNYLHINCEIENDAIDDVSQFEILEEYGRQMYEKNKNKVLLFLKNN